MNTTLVSDYILDFLVKKKVKKVFVAVSKAVVVVSLSPPFSR